VRQQDKHLRAERRREILEAGMQLRKQRA